MVFDCYLYTYVTLLLIPTHEYILFIIRDYYYKFGLISINQLCQFEALINNKKKKKIVPVILDNKYS